MEEFITHMESCMAAANMVKVTISKPRLKSNKYQNIFIRPVTIKDKRQYQVTKRTSTQDFVDNHTGEEVIVMIKKLLSDQFYNGDLFCTDAKHHLIQSKKGRAKVITKKSKRAAASTTHNRKKSVLIPADLPYLHDLKITSHAGKVYADKHKKYKQINKYVEIVSSLIGSDEVKEIYDMGSGKGYLTFALYHYLSTQSPGIIMKGIEIRPDLITLCNTIAEKNDMKGLSFEEGSIDTFKIKKADVVIALHACDIATDMAIAQGINADARYIITAPCCHKQIRKEMKKIDSALAPILHHGILLERQAEMITDGIRALLLESKGYSTKVFEFISSEHTGKNIMITAEYTGIINEKALLDIEMIKKEMGITTHFLETLI